MTYFEPHFDRQSPPRKSDVMFTMASPVIPESERWTVPSDPWLPTADPRFVDESEVETVSASDRAALAAMLDHEQHSWTI